MKGLTAHERELLQCATRPAVAEARELATPGEQRIQRRLVRRGLLEILEFESREDPDVIEEIPVITERGRMALRVCSVNGTWRNA